MKKLTVMAVMALALVSLSGAFANKTANGVVPTDDNTTSCVSQCADTVTTDTVKTDSVR